MARSAIAIAANVGLLYLLPQLAMQSHPGKDAWQAWIAGGISSAALVTLFPIVAKAGFPWRLAGILLALLPALVFAGVLIEAAGGGN